MKRQRVPDRSSRIRESRITWHSEMRQEHGGGGCGTGMQVGGPSTGLRHPYTSVFSYAVGSSKLSANEHFFFFFFFKNFYWYSDSSKFVRNNSNYIRRLSLLITDHVTAYASSNQVKPKSFESRRNSFFFLFFFFLLLFFFNPVWMRLMFKPVLVCSRT